ncbi:MAG: hypothetical protein E6Q92_06305 [Burkholderiaceae bacterium]|nr:MAG: hypothetical protein E6Q92_06305 [Burkholderiaceae bacterium]
MRRPVFRLHSLACALALGLALSAPAEGPAQAHSLPTLGDAVSGDIPLQVERKLGDEIMSSIYGDPAYLSDPVLQDYVRSLWLPLVKAAKARGEIHPEMEDRLAFETFVLKDKSVNAFALPGGFVGVHLGLMAITQTPGELASVLGHELSHVTQRHIARGSIVGQRQSLLATAATLLGLIAATRGGGSIDAASAVVMGSQAAAIQGQINFTRDMEREADRIGFGVLTDAGFPAASMALMFENLQNVNRLDDGRFPYLRTHPLDTERIAEARNRAGASLAAPPLEDTHAMMQARARVLMDTRPERLDEWQRAAESAERRPEHPMGRDYAATLSALKLKRWPQAEAVLARMQSRTMSPPARRWLNLLEAELALARQQHPRAEAAIARNLQALGKPMDDLDVRPELMLQSQIAFTRADRGPGEQQVRDRLQAWVISHPKDFDAWQELGNLWQLEGQTVRAIRAQAESSFAMGDLIGAIDRMSAAQKLVRDNTQLDPIEASVVASRLKVWRQTLMDRMKDRERRL